MFVCCHSQGEFIPRGMLVLGFVASSRATLVLGRARLELDRDEVSNQVL